VIEDTISGEDGLVRAANIRTSTGRTNRPKTKLYPLEVTTSDSLPQPKKNLLHQNEDVPSSSDSISVAEPLKDSSNLLEKLHSSNLKSGLKHYVPPGGCW